MCRKCRVGRPLLERQCLLEWLQHQFGVLWSRQEPQGATPLPRTRDGT